MSALSYFSPRFPPMRVVWEGSAATWKVFTGTSSVGRILQPGGGKHPPNPS
jgi:hypothetical protein